MSLVAGANFSECYICLNTRVGNNVDVRTRVLGSDITFVYRISFAVMFLPVVLCSFPIMHFDLSTKESTAFTLCNVIGFRHFKTEAVLVHWFLCIHMISLKI